MSTQTGTIRTDVENIFPIIKKFLYSDHDIFLRELVSNAVDATQKLSTLSLSGVAKGDIGDTKIEISIDEEAGTLTISDKGIGMTNEEVDKYINQIAFSSAQEFLDKYKDKTNIIGHFGLGFYSAFMVADKVEIHTLSYKYKQKAKSVRWSCDGSPNYEISTGEKKERGTDITLHISEDSKEFLQKSRIEELLNKYCRFLPVEIKFGENEKKETAEDGIETVEITDNIINNPNPAWIKKPADLSDEDYKNFYKELYPHTFDEPLFWIHLNVDHPFKLTGVLYFPKIKNNFEIQKNKIGLYSNQVFVTDNVEEIVPEFLQLLHGVLDSPDIPLNVSRSYLQSDPNVKRISSHITKKVASKLHDIFKEDRTNFEEKWKDISVFVKYGMLSNEKFADKGKSFLLLESVDGTHSTIEEYKEKIKDLQTDKDGKLVLLYTTSPDGQHGYISAAKDKGYDVLKMDHVLDAHFVGYLEQNIENVSLKRVDADIVDKLVEKDEAVESVLSKEQEEKLVELVKTQVAESSVMVEVKAMAPDAMPVTIVKPEFMRRMRDMSAYNGMGHMAGMPESYNLVLNGNHESIQKILDEKDSEKQTGSIKQLHDLALLAQGMLKGEDLTNFIKRSANLL